MKFLLSAALATGVAVLAATPASAADEILIKFSHVTTADSPKGMAAEKFKALAEQKTGGKVKVEVYHNSSLYKDKEEIEAVQLGAVQMLAPSLAKFGPLGVKEFDVFDLPYIFPDRAAMTRVTEGPIGQGLLKKLEAKGVVGLAFWSNGFKSLTVNAAAAKPADLAGLKIRVQPGSKALEAQVRALGAKPVPLPFSDVAEAMRTGAVDGGDNSPSNIYTKKMHEVQKTMLVTEHGFVGYGVIVNKKFWDGLPEDVRGQLREAMNEASSYANQIAEKENTDAMAAIKASGKIAVKELSGAEKAEWRKALLPVHDELADRVGRELLDAIYKETGVAK